MGDTGSPYNLPFPELTDAPDVPQDIEDLATTVHTVIAALASDVATKKVTVHPENGGFPLTGSSTGEVDVIDRVTVSSAAWARKLVIIGQTFHANTQTASNELTLYAGGTQLRTAQEDLTASKGVTTTLLATHDLAASTSVVIEMRFQRISGTGIASTSAGLYTFLLVVSIPV